MFAPVPYLGFGLFNTVMGIIRYSSFSGYLGGAVYSEPVCVTFKVYSFRLQVYVINETLYCILPAEMKLDVGDALAVLMAT